jgi:acetolactate synthase-1/2/3 large subunit
MLNRRDLLATGGAAGIAAAALAARGTQAEAGVELGRFARRPGVQGRMTGAQAAAATLACLGVRCVFGIPGAQTNELWDAFKARGVPYLLVANETSASVMADASARATGEVGVFSVVPGPGLTNAMTGIGEALMDSIPIVGIVTDIDRSPGAKIGQVHGLNNAAILQPVVKVLLEAHHQAEIPGIIFQAFQYARDGEPGPVGVLIPYPLFAEVWDYDTPPPPPMPLPFDEAAYRQVLCRLADRSLRVGIYAGLGCVDNGGTLAAVAEMLNAPVATSVSGKGCIPDSHPLAVGWGYGRQGTKAAEKAFKDVDLVLAVGVRYSEVSTAYYAIPRHDNLIHVDANPNNLGRNVPACVTLCADSRLFFERLLADRAAISRPDCVDVRKKIAKSRKDDRAETVSIKISQCVDPMFLFSQMRCALGPDELIFIDVTAATHWASESIEVQGPRRYFAPADNQSMGWAIPAAIGAQRVRPDRQVVSVTGDGCFLMAAIEMSTAARACLPVKFFVLDDGSYHYMQMLQEPVYRRTTATQIARIDYRAFAQAVGIGFNEITSNIDALPGIQRALAYPGPVLTHVTVSYEGREIRWLNALRRQYIRKMPNEDRLRLAARIGVRVLTPKDDND